MKKADAIGNAQTVFCWAVFYGHGALHYLANRGTEIELRVLFSHGEFIRERENDKFRSVVMVGAEFKWTDRPEDQTEVLSIRWYYSK